MNERQNEALKRQFHFDEWRGQTTLSENLFIWQFRFLGDELPNWQIHKTRTLAAPPVEQRPAGLRVVDEAAAGSPRLVQSIWRPSGAQAGALLSVDIYECATRLSAHDLLIRILGEFQSPLLERQTEGAPGDVTISHPGSRIVLFARGNQVIVARSVGPTMFRVTELAEQLDRILIEKPLTPAGLVMPNLSRLEAAAPELRIGKRIALEVEAIHPAGLPLMYKLFSSGGEVVAEEGRLMFEPTAPGEQPVEVYAVAPDRSAAAGRIQLRVE